MKTLCFAMMTITLLLEGAYLWARDAVTRDLPFAFLASDVVWTITIFSLIFHRRWPWVTVASAWVLFLTSAIVLEPFAFGHTTSAFIGRNALVLVNLLFAHMGLYYRRKEMSSGVK